MGCLISWWVLVPHYQLDCEVKMEDLHGQVEFSGVSVTVKSKLTPPSTVVGPVSLSCRPPHHIQISKEGGKSPIRLPSLTWLGGEAVT